jgi:hypothetical protein
MALTVKSEAEIEVEPAVICLQALRLALTRMCFT